MNYEIWNNWYVNVKLRDKRIQEALKCLRKINSTWNRLRSLLRPRRRYILRPYVYQKNQQLWSASTPIEEKTLFPCDVTKLLKETTDASKIHKQLISGPNITSQRHFHSSKNFRGRYRVRAGPYRAGISTRSRRYRGTTLRKPYQGYWM